MDGLEIVVVSFLGLVLGSFATALSYRIPRDLSIVKMKRSQCPSCHRNLAVPDLIPLFSWLFLRGKCRRCRAKIGWRYPLIELATLSLCLIFYAGYGFSAGTILIFVLAPILVSILDIDLHHKIIPDSLNLSILLLGVALFLVNAFLSDSPQGFFMEHGGSAAGGVLLYGFGSWLLRLAATVMMKREPMGLGDIKFFAAVGFWLGVDADAAALFMIVSGMCGVILSLIWKKRTGEAEVPFAPPMIIAFMVTLYFCIPSFINV